MSSIQLVNPNADVLRHEQALSTIVTSAIGLQSVVKGNFGPKGSFKMLVSGAGDIKITKDGKVLLTEMCFQDPTAAMIAKAAAAQDDIFGDGTTSIVIFIAELLRQSYRHINDGSHPRNIIEGIEFASREALRLLDEYKIIVSNPLDRELLLSVARTSLRTKVPRALADTLTVAVVDSMLTIARLNNDVDLNMIEIMKMQYYTSLETRLVMGLVLDHGSRHSEMPKKLENAYILILNVSLEYEKTEINSSFCYSSPKQREMLIQSERSFVDSKLAKIIELKNLVCKDSDGSKRKNFVIINQKGIDPMSLDVLAENGILALRRAKRRNMERLQLACGGIAQNSTDDLRPDILGYAGLVYEKIVGEEKFTFIEDVINPKSVTILINGPHTHTLNQIGDAIRDGLRAVKDVIQNRSVLPGAGYFPTFLHTKLKEFTMVNSDKKPELFKKKSMAGLRVFIDSLLIFPKVLISNAGLDSQSLTLLMTEEIEKSWKNNVNSKNLLDSHAKAIDLSTGLLFNPTSEGIYDNACVVKNVLSSATTMTINLLLVDEIMRAGRSSLKTGRELEE